jgi:putative FmdB family regulatory protein
MPIYEFVCKECSKNFEDLVMSASRIDEVVCPACGSRQVKKKMSTFASKPAADAGSSFSFNGGSASSCTTST